MTPKTASGAVFWRATAGAAACARRVPRASKRLLRLVVIGVAAVVSCLAGAVDSAGLADDQRLSRRAPVRRFSPRATAALKGWRPGWLVVAMSAKSSRRAPLLGWRPGRRAAATEARTDRERTRAAPSILAMDCVRGALCAAVAWLAEDMAVVLAAWGSGADVPVAVAREETGLRVASSSGAAASVTGKGFGRGAAWPPDAFVRVSRLAGLFIKC
jgi:hypothetical protein